MEPCARRRLGPDIYSVILKQAIIYRDSAIWRNVLKGTIGVISVVMRGDDVELRFILMVLYFVSFIDSPLLCTCGDTLN